jgi:multidrug efflux pump subunit AcrB
MVDFFIRRPIFATVSAVLMLLIGGICSFLLPIAQYPQIAPPQVQVTTTYTGADASSVARTVTTPIEQQINGTKGLIYYSSDSTSNGVSNIVATFDVGFSQDLAAVDIQNKVQTAQAQLPPEVKQYGVTIKKSSTDMVCVVNLISPDGRYDATFLDNYGQIYVADVLKRIPGISDANVLGRKYAMRVWIDPDRLANMRIAPTEVIQAIQQENVQAAAGFPTDRTSSCRSPSRGGWRRRLSSTRSSCGATTMDRSCAWPTWPGSSYRPKTSRPPATSTASRPGGS